MVANRLAFGWVLHQHQPVGNFPWVFAQVYKVCYEPLLEAFERHPALRVTLHYTGPLLDWLIAEHPDYITRLAALAQRGQIEILTGGYYEPILTILPESDQYGQITKMSTFIRQRFGYEPSGMWLAERVWEPQLPTPMARAGVRYTVLDDTHFFMAGLRSDQLYGYYMTEDQGHPVAVFPNPQVMRELIPWKPVRRIEAEFRRLYEEAQGSPRLVVLADDGEKFGSWPNTYDPLWRQGVFEHFLNMLEKNQEWLETVQLGEWMRRYPPLGRTYIPAASYAEMMEWALPAGEARVLEETRHQVQAHDLPGALHFMHGGNWRNFAAKYPEANNAHKKMLRVHERIHQVAPLLGPTRTQEAFDYLWKGQCNCGYWHGVFGGLYLADIRSAIYQNLVHAEAIADGAQPIVEPSITLTDFDCDGNEELLVEGPQMDVYIAPHDGGSIFEWDWKTVPFNLVDTLARREEAYHHKLIDNQIQIVPPVDPLAIPLIDRVDVVKAEETALDAEEESHESQSIHELLLAKEAGLERLLQYDDLRRTALRERFFAASTTLEQVIAGAYQDQGDFAGAPFIEQVEGVGVGMLVVGLWRDGTVRTPQGPATLRLRKAIAIATDTSELRVTYTLHNTSPIRIVTRFAVEGNWGLLGGGGNPAAWYTVNGERLAALDMSGTHTHVHTVALTNAGVGIQLQLAPGVPADLWRYPVETVSNSEAGFERSYQCSCTLLHWPVDLLPGDRWSVTLRLALSQP